MAAARRAGAAPLPRRWRRAGRGRGDAVPAPGRISGAPGAPRRRRRPGARPGHRPDAGGGVPRRHGHRTRCRPHPGRPARPLHTLPALRSADPAVRLLHLDLHPHNVLLAAHGPVVIDWTDSAEGPPALDRTTTALILAEVAVAPGHPLAVAAGALLSAYVVASGPLDQLAEAVRHRAAGHAPDPERLPEAAALVTQTIRAVAPTAAQPSSAPPRSRS
ncbi:phosphotransferase [Micromonospora sp. b486]|uniref:phosphotransferase n=1 Tax=Micromonospora sp. b486 TaxID=3053986 RepID=UPI00338E0493